eukprot:scaffold1267_cov117-Skeletonema_marinoi.AAC.2
MIPTTMMMRLLLILQMAAVINSFSTVVINKKHGASSLLQLHARNNNQRKNNTPRRSPPNRRMSIKWVIQGIEKVLAEECEPSSSNHGGKPKYSYKRRIDASLVDALYLMANANSQKDVLDAEKRIKVLLKNPSEFPVEVTERAIRATSVAGLSLSVHLLKLLLRGDNVTALPSSIAYISVLSFLRKIGRIDRLEDTLAELASVSRRIQVKNPSQSGVDIVAFNTYLGAIFDAAAAGRPFLSSCDNESEMLDSNLFNFTNFNNTLDGTTSSEKYLYKGLNLLRGDAARKKFALEGDPDIYSFNSLLTAVAKCAKPGCNLLSITDSCLLTMKKQGIECDTLTYNARIQAAIAANEEDRAIQLIDELLASPKLDADRYTINLALVPFVNSGRKGQMLTLMRDFYEMNAGKNNRIILSAFEAFLNTLVKNDEVELARDVFDAFFLSIPKDRMQLTGIRPNPTTKHFNIMLGGYSRTGDALKAFELFDTMLDIGVALDGFTVTSLMTHPISPEKITSLLVQVETERAMLNPAAYRSIIGAYGDAGDAASACWMFLEMGRACQKRGRGAESWNVLLGALARGCTGDKVSTALDIYGSFAAKRGNEDLDVEELASDEFISLVDGMSCLDASFTILDMMRSGNQTSLLMQSPKPNSQGYCLLASALSGFGTSASQADRALTLFRDAMKQGGVNPDGRFLNAILRCFGDDIEAALAAWKTDVGPAAASQQGNGNINLQQAYNGLMHVCGRALRPDIATRIAYAMNKAGVEPTEVSLNCYMSGKRVAMEGKTGNSKKGLGLTNQYENLLSVECTKYNTRKWDKSKRRAGDKKIRIILLG